MVLETGSHDFTCGESPDLRWASASSVGPATISTYRGGALQDRVHLSGPTHTWWPNNPLFDPALGAGETIRIVIEGVASMRFECGGLV